MISLLSTKVTTFSVCYFQNGDFFNFILKSTLEKFTKETQTRYRISVYFLLIHSPMAYNGMISMSPSEPKFSSEVLIPLEIFLDP